jgi:hypothetical protein
VLGFHRPGCKRPETWKGVLFRGQSTGFGDISWYGDACDGVLESYSLGVQRGEDYWLLEIGHPPTLLRAPIVEPSPREQCFLGAHPGGSARHR